MYLKSMTRFITVAAKTPAPCWESRRDLWISRLTGLRQFRTGKCSCAEQTKRQISGVVPGEETRRRQGETSSW